MMISCWTVDLRLVSSAELFEWCLREHGVDHMLVALRLEEYEGRWRALVPGSSDRFETHFSAHIQERFLASGWPGTESFRQPGLMYLLEFNRAILNLMLEIESDLSKWSIDDRSPLPEDICLFRDGDPHPVFLSVIHEGDAWLLTNRNPMLQGVSLDKAVESDRLREELIAFPGKYFCRPWRGKVQAVDKRLLPKPRGGSAIGR